MRLVVLGGLLVWLGCGDPGTPAPRFRVARIEPDPAAGPLRLNRELEIQFSGALDPGSVTPDSIQVLDSQGRRAEGTFELSDFVVKFWPRPPVTSALDDGTWRPGARYWLHVLGFPSPNALRQQRTHAFLSESLSVPLRVVDVDSGDTPFLPEDRTPFLLLEPFPVLFAEDGRVLIVRMSKPPDPRTVSVRSFSVHDPDNRELRIDSWKIDAGKFLDDTRRGCRVDLHLREPITVGKRHYLVLGDAAQLPRDYGGEPLGMYPHRKGIIEILRRQDQGTAVLREEFDEVGIGIEDPSGLDTEDNGVLALGGGQLRPFLPMAAGDGSLGALAPVRDTVLAAGVPFDPGDGRLLTVPDADFQFSSVRVPAGVRLTVRGPGSVVLRSQRGFKIDGTLELACPRAPAPPRAYVCVDTLLADCLPGRERHVPGGGCLLVTSGSIHRDGVCVAESGPGLALRIAAAGGIRSATPWPQGTETYRIVPPGHRGRTPEGQNVLTAEPDARPDLREQFQATALLPWRRLGGPLPAQLRVRYGPAMLDARIRVSCRLVGAEPNDPDRPHESVAGRFESGPLLTVPGGARFAQLRVVFEVPPGVCHHLPHLEWVTLEP